MPALHRGFAIKHPLMINGGSDFLIRRLGSPPVPSGALLSRYPAPSANRALILAEETEVIALDNPASWEGISQIVRSSRVIDRVI